MTLDIDFFLYLKALHIIFVVTWFAGLFYLVRLFVYHSEAYQMDEPNKTVLMKQYLIMEKRLLNIITLPSSVLVVLSGSAMIIINPDFLEMPWMHAKLAFVCLLLVYQWRCVIIYKNLLSGIVKITSSKMRLWNEVSTLILFAVVFLVVMKNNMALLSGLISLLILALVLYIAIRLYRNYRNKG